MNIFKLLILYMIPSTTIKDIELPVCKNCKYFIPYENKEQYSLGKCYLFAKKNIISGEILHEYADICRISHSKCGYNGSLYEEI